MEGLFVYNVIVLVLQILLPILLAILIGGFVAGVLQGVSQIHDQIIGFTARFVCAALALYLLSGSIASQVLAISNNCWGVPTK